MSRRRWLPHFVKSDEDPPDHREAWWGPLNVSLRRMGTVLWPTRFRLALIIDIRVFGLQFVFMVWRPWPHRRRAPPKIELALKTVEGRQCVCHDPNYAADEMWRPNPDCPKCKGTGRV